MDKAAKVAIKEALDKAIKDTAEEEFRRLVQGRDRVGVAKKICGALRSFDGLQGGIMPAYNKWDALIYLLWYQPDRINLAYSLVQIISGNWVIPLADEDQGLEVSDFGCGELAMQFGLVLAMADTLKAGPPPPALTIISSDTSQPMLLIGQKLWKNFVIEINTGNYPNLATIKRICNDL